MKDSLLVIAAGLIWGAGYVIACALYPFANCGRCGGGGRIRSSSGRTFRRCKKCSGTGGRLRIGNRIYNYLRGNR